MDSNMLILLQLNNNLEDTLRTANIKKVARQEEWKKCSFHLHIQNMQLDRATPAKLSNLCAVNPCINIMNLYTRKLEEGGRDAH